MRDQIEWKRNETLHFGTRVVVALHQKNDTHTKDRYKPDDQRLGDSLEYGQSSIDDYATSNDEPNDYIDAEHHDNRLFDISKNFFPQPSATPAISDR